MKSQPVIGTYMSFLLFGGEFPGDQIIPRLFIVHVLLIPGLLLALITAHMLLLVYHKHTQWPGPGRTEQNVVGYPMLPVYAAKAGGFFFIVFGVTALMGGLLTINPVWKFGPYDPSKVTAGSQPDWYMGWPDGALRIMPNIETHIWHHTISWNVMLPIIVLPTAMFIGLLLLPFIEAWITGDKRDHHLLQRPRNAPTRTATMVALMTMYGLFWAAGGNDIIAIRLHLSINQITYFMRGAVFIGPVIAFLITKRWCISLQRKDKRRPAARLRDRHHHALPRGRLHRTAPAAVPGPRLHDDRLATATRTSSPSSTAGPDANGVEPPAASATRLAGVRHRLRKLMYADNMQKPTLEELEEGHHHAEHEHELQAPMDGHAADGHQFDGHHLVEGEDSAPTTDRARRRKPAPSGAGFRHGRQSHPSLPPAGPSPSPSPGPRPPLPTPGPVPLSLPRAPSPPAPPGGQRSASNPTATTPTPTRLPTDRQLRPAPDSGQPATRPRPHRRPRVAPDRQLHPAPDSGQPATRP